MAITISGSGIVEANLADNAVTLAKMASGTDGQIITYDASGDPAAVGPGTDGQVLTSTGSTTPPAFEAVAAGGKVLQVVSTEKSSEFSSGSASWVDITGMSVTITPASTSKILVMVHLKCSTSGGSVYYFTNLVRGSTSIHNGDTAGSRTLANGGGHTPSADGMMPESLTYLDASHGGDGSTAITYKMQLWSHAGTSRINRTYDSTNAAYTPVGASSITVMEIGA